MKGLFKSKPRTPPDIVRQTRDLLVYADRSVSTPDLRESKSQEKLAELSKSLRESKLILYGNSEAEPVAEACAQLTLEFFKGETLRGLITSLPYLSLEGRKDATQVNSRLVASDYLESNIDLMDVLVDGFETHRSGVTLYGTMFRECIRHQIVAKYVLDSQHVKKFFLLRTASQFRHCC
ncbi:BnaA01g17790D [Brassica napus]|uniref:BnaA01g17790D protein n=1 Tax=Brassica napus TaxID=3708 RepID=A0A078HWZ3_BRANA|nr:BnaA01g17790D [Brassica napus]